MKRKQIDDGSDQLPESKRKKLEDDSMKTTSNEATDKNDTVETPINDDNAQEKKKSVESDTGSNNKVTRL